MLQLGLDKRLIDNRSETYNKNYSDNCAKVFYVIFLLNLSLITNLSVFDFRPDILKTKYFLTLIL